MVELVLIRHAETAYNHERRYQGWRDIPLHPAGVASAVRLGCAMRRQRLIPRALWTSDLSRARRTAALVFPGLSAHPDPRLRELDFGDFEGRTPAENADRYGDTYTRWLDGPAARSAPSGESLICLQRRVLDWWNERPRVGRMAIITHFGPLHVLVARLLGVDFLDSVQRFPVWPGEALIVRIDGGTSCVRKPAWADRTP